MRFDAIRFQCGIPAIERCHTLALETLDFNIQPFRDGLLETAAPCILAGESYNTPWTRDCAYNVWNAGALLDPAAAKNTLLSVLLEDVNGVRIGGQYWDAIAWVLGAWCYYCVSGDRDFLALARVAVSNSLDFFEETEFDGATGLFTGAASYGDGVASYPEPYNDAGGSSGILDYPKAHPEIGKIRMKCLSTNCLYYAAYRLGCRMELELGSPIRMTEWAAKAESLRESINTQLWMADRGRYGYFLGNDNERIDYMEGLGAALAILTGVAGPEQAREQAASQFSSPYGIPCVWPVFPRFESPDNSTFGRHNGTVWPFIQGYWADAAAQSGRLDLFDHELMTLTETAGRARNFFEIFHPLTGEPYGGLQIDNGVMREWGSCPRQTWSATAYLRMIHQVLCGMQFEPDGIRFAPKVPDRFETVTLSGIRYRDAVLSIEIAGHGDRVYSMTVDGAASYATAIPAGLVGNVHIRIEMQE